MHRKKKQKYSQINLNVNPMRRMQKLFKYSSIRQTDFSKLVDLNSQKVKKIIVDDYQVYKFEFPDGAYLIKNFLNLEQQIQIAFHSLNSFIHKPYRTNLSSSKGLYQQNSHDEQETQIAQQPENIVNNYYFNDKIRWANLGYNYDWTNRKYPNTKSHVPTIIEYISQKANKTFNKVKNEIRQYNPQAVIVNYYKQKDAMTSHLDDAEEDQQSPIYSFSFGLSCVFLIGQTHKQVEPIAVRIDAGDIFIMSGHSRKSYHGVPRVISDTFKRTKQELKNQQFLQEFKKQIKSEQKINDLPQIFNYLRNHRININIRQVYSQAKQNQQQS